MKIDTSDNGETNCQSGTKLEEDTSEELRS